MLSANLILMNNGREPYNHEIHQALSRLCCNHWTQDIRGGQPEETGREAYSAVYHSRAPLAYMP